MSSDATPELATSTAPAEVYTGTSAPSLSTEPAVAPATRKSGRVWREQKQPLRISALGAGRKTWAQKQEQRVAEAAFKAKAQELKDEKEGEKRRRVEERKLREETKKEKERYELLAKTMHAKVCLDLIFLWLLRHLILTFLV